MRITVVTPSFNQAVFLEACIRSVVRQEYPDLEYLIIDGGSTDGSVDIIKRYEGHLAYWVSEKDSGQYDAINKGFERATGEILAWLNADDMYLPWTFEVVAEIFSAFPEVEWITSLFPLVWDERGRVIRCTPVRGFDRRLFFRGGKIQQESTFWRRSLWERAGGRLDTSFHLAADVELWARFWQTADLYGVAVPLGGSRYHPGRRAVRLREKYNAETRNVLKRHIDKAGQPLLAKVAAIGRALQPVHFWRKSWAQRLLRRLFYEGKGIYNNEDGWCLATVYFL